MDLFGRRDFIKIGSLGFFGLGLNEFFALKALAADTPVHGKPLETDRSIILVWLSGGPPQTDTFDMKPDAPKEVRGLFKPIATNVAGIQICEHLPRTAQVADKFAIIRSMTSREANHERAINYLLTGYLPLQTIEFPSMGSVIAKEKGPRNGLPPYVAVPNTFPSYGPGFLGGAYGPFIAGDPNVTGYRVRDLNLPTDIDWNRVNNRRWLLNQIDQYFREIDTRNEFRTVDTFYEKAYDLMRSSVAKKAFDIESEPEGVRSRYGRTPVGQGCLLARRLVEAGVRFVTVSKGWLNWDTHGNNFNTLEKLLLPELDMAYSALLEDLHQRGMLESTLVVMMGEFGRTPQVNAEAGRDHWSKAFSIVMAGGGVTGGQVLGATDGKAAEVVSDPYQVEDLVATIYSRVGIDFTQEYLTPIGRPVKLSNGGKVIAKLFG
ncbi:MAG TPA: DUF1501 domain-containing protein [Acidobacteriota bacterium]|jgi:hypothetical protein|nr:DUF1501 domain-containing protein [Acidobacteriota bacterium]